MPPRTYIQKIKIDYSFYFVDDSLFNHMALYGLKESSTVSDEHDGSGQDWKFDVGQVFNRAALTIGRIELYFNEN